MFIVPVSSVNLKSNNTQKPNAMRTKAIGISNYSEQIFPNANVLRAQMLFKTSNNNKVSFNGLVLKPNLFKDVAVNELHPLWQKLIARETELYIKPNELRSEFSRDCDRILHSDSYNRMMGKTQVFSNPISDMTCTRMGHVNQVASIAETIAEFLGLNPKLTRAISLGHDLGHSPFGHSGEVCLNNIMKEHNLKSTFWHEKNSLRFVDDIETKLDPKGYEKNLDLTYAVRDGIVCHCGEIDENALKPRHEYIDLRTIKKSDKVFPFTWEGCVMRISDKIAYLGRDIEDAINNKFLHPDKKQELIKLIKENSGLDFEEINNTVLIGHFISDICANSNPQEGLKLSEPTFKLMNTIKKFNYENIYMPKDRRQDSRNNLVLTTIFNNLNGLYAGKNTLSKLEKVKEEKPKLIETFKDWLVKYSDIAPQERIDKKLANKVIYSIDNQEDYKLSIIEFISGMTDRFAIKSYEEITSFG